MDNMIKKLLYVAIAGFCLTMSFNAQAAMKAADRVDFEKVKAVKAKAVRAFAAADSSATDSTATQETWKAIGKATWVEGPADGYTTAILGKSWQIDVEESEQTAGRYRMVPYGAGSALSDLLWLDGDNYMYVNAQNPDKVYIEDYEHPAFLLSQIVTENGWNNGAAFYGTLADKVINFPASSFGISTDKGTKWYTSNTNGKFVIYLPGAVVKDYAFSSTITNCAADRNVKVTCKAGADIACVKLKVYTGEVDLSTAAKRAAIVKDALANGDSIAATGQTVWTAPADGRYSAFVVATDSVGDVKEWKWSVVIAYDPDADNWESIGNGTFTDPIVPALGYENTLLAESQTFEVAMERNKTNANLLRLVNPYAKHPYFVKYKSKLTKDGHNHYIVMDTTDPDYVVVAESILGFNLGSGQAAVNSAANRYAQYGKDAVLKYYGAITIKDGVITINKDALFASEVDYENNALYRCDAGQILLPGTSGIATPVADAAADVRYYNLQGVEVATPQAGQLLIRKQGNTVTKILVK